MIEHLLVIGGVFLLVMTLVEPGFYHGVPNQAYHDGPGLGHSIIVRLVNWTPAHSRIPVEKTKEMDFGSALHAMIFEFELFKKQYVFTDRYFRSKEDRAWKAEQEAAGRIVLKKADEERLIGMAKAVAACRSAMDLLEGEGEAEISGYWYDPYFPEVLCKFRVDWLRKPSGVCVDLKTTKDARPSNFIRSAHNFGYHLQAAHYTYGLTQITKIEHDQFFFIAVEKEPPYGVNVYQAAPEFIQLGQIECQRGLKVYADCLKTKTWPAYPDQTLSLPLPGWVKRREMPVVYD
jgi:exodeoxyribonuclease VIII